jgi:putative ABC transport system permease protein
MTTRPLTVIWSIFRLSIANLAINKLRTFLTLLGIIVGVAAMISVVTIIRGLNDVVASTFSANGSTVFTVSKGPTVITSREQMLKVVKRKDVTEDDADAITRICAVCSRIGYAARSGEIVKQGDRTAENVSIKGVTLSMFAIDGTIIDSGRGWTEAEGRSGEYVAVIGTDVVKNVLTDVPADEVLGSHIRVRGSVFRVIGVAAPLGTIFGVSRDNFVLIPYETSLHVFPVRGSLVISIQVDDPADMESAKDEVNAIMRSRRGKIATIVGTETEEDEGFTIESADVFVGLYKSATDNIYLVTIGVSAISLVVGGIVVMNIMLVSVAERTKEIGLRKAVGARRRDIMLQFLIEALVLASVGGAIGVFAGFGLAYAISYLIGFPTLVSPWSVGLGVGVSSAVGITSGLYPAWRAADLNPVEAMRSE